MDSTNIRSDQAEILYRSGFIAFQNKAYKECIDYFKRAQALGLDFIKSAEADRFIGSAYLELKKGGLARKYLRKAIASGMFSPNSIFSLVHAEEKRSLLYKWILGDIHAEKVEELLDWFLLGDIPNQNSLNIVALNAFKNKKWHKSIVLYDSLKAFDKSNLQNQTYSILSLYYAGELYRARIEIEDLFSNTPTPIKELQETRADLSMIFGEFKLAKNYYAHSFRSDEEFTKSLLQALDVYSRVSEISESFRSQALYFFVKGYYSTTYIRSIDNIENFELMLKSLSVYFEYYQNKHKTKVKELKEDSRKQFHSAYELHNKQPKIESPKPPEPSEKLTFVERMHKRHLYDMEAIKELTKMNAVMNTMSNFLFANKFDDKIWESSDFLRSRLWFYNRLFFILRGVLFAIPALIFLDDLLGAITGENLLLISFSSIFSSATSTSLQIFFAVSWFLFLFFIDTVLEKKINIKIVDALKSTLIDYTKQITYMLVAEEAAYELLLASQPIPHLGMKVSDLLEIGLSANKPWEVRLPALIMAGSKAVSSEILPFKEHLMAELSHDNDKFRFISAVLLAIGKIPESLTVIQDELQKERNEFNSDPVLNLALQSLAKYGDQSSVSILNEFIVRNIDKPKETLLGIEALKVMPVNLRIRAVLALIDVSIEKKLPINQFLSVFSGMGDVVVSPLINFYNERRSKLYGFDDLELLLAILNTNSQMGKKAVKDWLVGSEPAQPTSIFDLSDMRYEFFIGNKKFDLISDIAFDENLSVNVRKKAAYYIAFLEKEKIQDVVFRLWQNAEVNETYVKILGDIGTPACVEKLIALLENCRDTIDDTVGKTEYSYIYSTLALCGDAGKDKLKFLVNGTESLKVERLFALAALYGTNQGDFANLRKLKKALSDKDINEYHRSHVFWVMEWCVVREDDIEFKLQQHRNPSPKKYYQFLRWASQNSKLPEQVHVMAEFALSSSSFKEWDREWYIPKSYTKIEVFWEKMKSKLSKKNQ